MLPEKELAEMFKSMLSAMTATAPLLPALFFVKMLRLMSSVHACPGRQSDAADNEKIAAPLPPDYQTIDLC